MYKPVRRNERPVNKKILNKEKDFPSLVSRPNNESHINNPNNVVAWRKRDSYKNNICEKAKNGFILLNSYPRFVNSPDFPMFQ